MNSIYLATSDDYSTFFYTLNEAIKYMDKRRTNYEIYHIEHDKYYKRSVTFITNLVYSHTELG